MRLFQQSALTIYTYFIIIKCQNERLFSRISFNGLNRFGVRLWIAMCVWFWWGYWSISQMPNSRSATANNEWRRMRLEKREERKKQLVFDKYMSRWTITNRWAHRASIEFMLYIYELQQTAIFFPSIFVNASWWSRNMWRHFKRPTHTHTVAQLIVFEITNFISHSHTHTQTLSLCVDLMTAGRVSIVISSFSSGQMGDDLFQFM